MKRRPFAPSRLGEGRIKRKGKTLLICLALPLAVGLLASLLTLGGMGDYAGMAKPPLAPPGWVFPIAWTLLYLLMGLASWLAVGAAASEERKQEALSLYAVFFGLGRYYLALFWLVVLLVLVLLTWRQFRRLDRRAGALLTPYILWLCFALYLNLGAAILN